MKYKILSLQQPWATLLCLFKDVENRTWKLPEKYIDETVLIHASAKWAKGSDDLEQFFSMQQLTAVRRLGIILNPNTMPTSAIVGSVVFVGCETNNPSIWAEKDKFIYNWIREQPILFKSPILNVKGKLGFWDYEIENLSSANALYSI